MHLSRALTCLGLLTGLVTSIPTASRSTRTSAFKNVVYWGQNGGGTIENNDLSAYCTPEAGIDIIVLAFLYQFGNGNTIASGTIGQSCWIGNTGQSQNCEALASAIARCQSNGVTIILSLGGAVGSYSLSSSEEAKAIANNLWAAYGNSGTSRSVPRPFGSTFVNGFDFDLELNRGNQFYADMISTLRQNFQSDPGNKYYITGAPQCPIPEPNMGVVVENSKFDYLWPQFYNNNNYTYPCALPINGNAPFNYDQWLSYTSKTPSADAKVLIGLPASPLGANGAPSGETYYATPAQVARIVGGVKNNPRFGGIMMWSAGFSDNNIIDGCTFAQQVRSILDTGSPCGASGPPKATASPASTSTTTQMTTKTTTMTTTTVVAKPTSTKAAATVAQWQQCGGIGYTGAAQCQAPYKCVVTGAYWSHCA
ncbi:putative endochitinase CHI2 [Poronia punctata]|nr:putative endochitinase CHI2 [Poronia punctata]